jgi:hypothetical protein
MELKIGVRATRHADGNETIRAIRPFHSCYCMTTSYLYRWGSRLLSAWTAGPISNDKAVENTDTANISKTPQQSQSQPHEPQQQQQKSTDRQHGELVVSHSSQNSNASSTSSSSSNFSSSSSAKTTYESSVLLPASESDRQPTSAVVERLLTPLQKANLTRSTPATLRPRHLLLSDCFLNSDYFGHYILMF